MHAGAVTMVGTARVMLAVVTYRLMVVVSRHRSVIMGRGMLSMQRHLITVTCHGPTWLHGQGAEQEHQDKKGHWMGSTCHAGDRNRWVKSVK